jgi:hypothetical protein
MSIYSYKRSYSHPCPLGLTVCPFYPYYPF